SCGIGEVRRDVLDAPPGPAQVAEDRINPAGVGTPGTRGVVRNPGLDTEVGAELGQAHRDGVADPGPAADSGNKGHAPGQGIRPPDRQWLHWQLLSLTPESAGVRVRPPRPEERRDRAGLCSLVVRGTTGPGKDARAPAGRAAAVRNSPSAWGPAPGR